MKRARAQDRGYPAQRPAPARRRRPIWPAPDLLEHRLNAVRPQDVPLAAAWLREGLADTFTVNRLGVTAALLKTVEPTNPCESMIEIVRDHSRRVKRWQHGDMALWWTAAGMLAAEASSAASAASSRCPNSSLHSKN